VLVVAFITASFAGLVTRKPFYYLPIYWVIGIVSLLVGQVIGRARGITLLNVGLVELGTGLVVNVGMLIALQYATAWYNQKSS
jgi:hypothetical protein